MGKYYKEWMWISLKFAAPRIVLAHSPLGRISLAGDVMHPRFSLPSQGTLKTTPVVLLYKFPMCLPRRRMRSAIFLKVKPRGCSVV